MKPKYTAKEVLYRMSDPELVVSHAFRQLMQVYDLVSPCQFSRLCRRVRGMTICSNGCLRGLYDAVKYTLEQNIPGDIVECGSAQGGSAALMGLTLKEICEDNRLIWVFDNFEGLPAPTLEDPDYEFAKNHTGSRGGKVEQVAASFKALGLYDRTRLVKGLFDDTLAKAEVEQIAVLHLDCDWYHSVTTCLEHLYDKVAVGGVIQFDDYGFWKGARKAVDQFFDRRGISPELTRLDYHGRQMIKPG